MAAARTSCLVMGTSPRRKTSSGKPWEPAGRQLVYPVHKQNGEGSEGVSRQAGDRVRNDLLLGVGERLSYCGGQVAQPSLGKAFTQGAGSLRTAGKEKHRLAVGGKNLPHRVAVKAVGRHHRPLLPGPAQPGGKVLQAGDARQYLEGNVICLQKRNQRAGAGVKLRCPRYTARRGSARTASSKFPQSPPIWWKTFGVPTGAGDIPPTAAG